MEIKKKSGKKTLLITILVLVPILLGAGTAFYFYRQITELKRDPQKFVEANADETIAAVSKIMVLPEDEEPTIASVSNLEQLKDQPFFAKAKVGDKVLIYPTANKVILFDPISNKIIEVAPFNN